MRDETKIGKRSIFNPKNRLRNVIGNEILRRWAFESPSQFRLKIQLRGATKIEL